MRTITTRALLATAALAVGLSPPAAGQAEDDAADDGQTRMESNPPDATRGRVAMAGSPRLAVGTCEETENGIIVAEIVTKAEGALVNRFAVNPLPGESWPIM